MSAREELHRIIDLLSDTDLPAALELLERLHESPDDGFLRTLVTAPEDDEELTAEEHASLDRAWDEAQRGEIKPWLEVRSRLG